MKKYFSIHILFLPIAFAVIGIQACCNEKNISSNEKTKDSVVANKKSSDGLAISPNHFRVDAIVTNQPKLDSLHEHIIYSLLIREVLARGSSLVQLVAAGDTITATVAANPVSYSFMIKKGNQVIAFIEERMQLNSDQPLFLLRDIHKK